MRDLQRQAVEHRWAVGLPAELHSFEPQGRAGGHGDGIGRIGNRNRGVGCLQDPARGGGGMSGQRAGAGQTTHGLERGDHQKGRGDRHLGTCAGVDKDRQQCDLGAQEGRGARQCGAAGHRALSRQQRCLFCLHNGEHAALGGKGADFAQAGQGVQCGDAQGT